MAKRRGRRSSGRRRGQFCPYRTTFSVVVSLYIIYMLYHLLNGASLPQELANVYDHRLLQVLVMVAVVLLVIRRDHLQAVLLVVAYLLTYLVADTSTEAFEMPLREEQHEDEEDHEENMLDYAEFADSPVGKAYNPKENYISGIYDFTGHLKYDQLPVVPS